MEAGRIVLHITTTTGGRNAFHTSTTMHGKSVRRHKEVIECLS